MECELAAAENLVLQIQAALLRRELDSATCRQQLSLVESLLSDLETAADDRELDLVGLDDVRSHLRDLQAIARRETFAEDGDAGVPVVPLALMARGAGLVDLQVDGRGEADLALAEERAEEVRAIHSDVRAVADASRLLAIAVKEAGDDITLVELNTSDVAAKTDRSLGAVVEAARLKNSSRASNAAVGGAAVGGVVGGIATLSGVGAVAVASGLGIVSRWVAGLINRSNNKSLDAIEEEREARRETRRK